MSPRLHPLNSHWLQLEPQQGEPARNVGEPGYASVILGASGKTASRTGLSRATRWVSWPKAGSSEGPTFQG